MTAGAMAMPGLYLTMLNVAIRETVSILLLLAFDVFTVTMSQLLTSVLFGGEKQMKNKKYRSNSVVLFHFINSFCTRPNS